MERKKSESQPNTCYSHRGEQCEDPIALVIVPEMSLSVTELMESSPLLFLFLYLPRFLPPLRGGGFRYIL